MSQSWSESKKFPLLPLRDMIIFPHMVVPLFVGREKSISALEEAQRFAIREGGKTVGAGVVTKILA